MNGKLIRPLYVSLYSPPRIANRHILMPSHAPPPPPATQSPPRHHHHATTITSLDTRDNLPSSITTVDHQTLQYRYIIYSTKCRTNIDQPPHHHHMTCTYIRSIDIPIQHYLDHTTPTKTASTYKTSITHVVHTSHTQVARTRADQHHDCPRGGIPPGNAYSCHPDSTRETHRSCTVRAVLILP
jgi:hypothetical protein